MRERLIAAACAAFVLCASAAHAQDSASAKLERQWRDAKRKELLAEQTLLATHQASIAAQLVQLDNGATPDTLTADVPPASAPPATKKTVTDTASVTKTLADGSVASTTKTTTETAKPASENEDAARGHQKFGGLDFGIGISYTGDIGIHDRIGGAEVDPNGIVRITDTNDVNARIMLESHYFFTPVGRSLLGVRNHPDTQDGDGNVIKAGAKLWGIGPFVALRPGTDSVIDAIGAGVMIGFRKSSSSSESFNFGIGAVVDPNVQILGDGIVPNKPLPANETKVRFRETSQAGVLLLTSFSF